MSDAVTRQIAKTVENLDQNKRRFDALAHKIEADGWRIVDTDSSPGGENLAFVDFRTGKVLVSLHHADYETYEPVGEKWQNVDYIYNQTWLLPELVGDLPHSLADAIVEWAHENEDEARVFVAAHCHEG